MKNFVALIGRIGNDLELKSFENGGSVLNISLAVDDSYLSDKGEKVDRTYWFDVVGQNKIAEMIAKKFKKGDQISVSGKLRQRSYENDKGKQYVFETIIQNVEFLASVIKEK